MADFPRFDSGGERLPLTIEHSVKRLKAVETLLGSGFSVAAEGEEHLDTFVTAGATLANFGNFYRADVWLVQLLSVCNAESGDEVERPWGSRRGAILEQRCCGSKVRDVSRVARDHRPNVYVTGTNDRIVHLWYLGKMGGSNRIVICVLTSSTVSHLIFGPARMSITGWHVAPRLSLDIISIIGQTCGSLFRY